MSLIYRCRDFTLMFFRQVILKVICISGLATYCHATELSSVQLHGFIAQGAIDVNESNFVNDDGKFSTELTEIGINASYQVNNFVRLTGQAVYLNGGNRYVEGARIDYALIDFGIYQDENWLVNLYLGRYKNNNWLYSSTRDVPHARPSIILPQSLYFDGFRDIAMGSDGVSVKINHTTDTLGSIDLYLNYGKSSLSTKDVRLLLGDTVQGSGEQEFDAQLGLYWQPEYSPWQFGLSALDSDFVYKKSDIDLYTDSSFSFQQYTINALYEGNKWEFSTEIFQQKFLQKGLYGDSYRNMSISQGGFVQTRYKYSHQLSLLGRVERFYQNKDDKNGSKLDKRTFGTVPHYFGYLNNVTLGASYDLSSNSRIQIEHHWNKGTSRLTPFVMPNTKINNQEHWHVLAVQFMYWF